MKKTTIIILTLILAIGTLFGVVMQNDGIAYADDIIATNDVESMCRNYTDSLEPNGVNFATYLSDFASQVESPVYVNVAWNVTQKMPKGNVFGSSVTYSGGNNVVNGIVDGDDNIVKLIPRVLFTYDNKTLFIGKKYGFLIVTNCSSVGFCTSTVIMIEVVGNVSDYLADIMLNVRNTMEFAYVTNNNNTTTLPNIDLTSSGIIVSYKLNNGLTSAVVPMPGIQNFTNATTTEKRLGYFESNRYTLANISFGVKISNQNNYNQWDSQYNASADTGYFFIGNNLSISCDDMRRLFVAGLRNDI